MVLIHYGDGDVNNYSEEYAEELQEILDQSKEKESDE